MQIDGLHLTDPNWTDGRAVDLPRPIWTGDRLMPTHPQLSARLDYGGGGLVFFDARQSTGDLRQLTGLMSVYPGMLDYGAFLIEPEATAISSDFLAMLRIVSFRSIKRILKYGWREGELPLPSQDLTVPDALLAFIDREKTRLGDIPAVAASDRPKGHARLGFGLLVEDGNVGVYRIWSRVWYDQTPLD